MKVVTVVDEPYYHHLPDWAWEDMPELCGLTLRQALRALRNVEWGDIGGMYAVALSDGSLLSVELQPANGGTGELMRSQRAVREYAPGRGGTQIYYNIGKQ